MEQEITTVNNFSLAALLGISNLPFTVILGKPKKDKKSIKVKNFAKRVQKCK